MRAALALTAVLVAVPCRAQEAGWHYAPFPGEGDRAALGCSYGASPAQYTCLAVRCEDDFSVGLYIHTSRGAADAGQPGLARSAPPVVVGTGKAV